MRLAEQQLIGRFPVEARSVEQLLISAMRTAAQEVGADWTVVRRADAAQADSLEWQRLLALVRRALPMFETELAGRERTQLLLYPGQLARYGQLGVFGALRDRLGRPGGPHGVWVLVPSDDQSALPTIDGQAIPVITPGEWARIPEPWLRNVHRAAIA
jgi:hypothetical protein